MQSGHPKGETAPSPTTWGVVSTIKAPAAQILEFTAYHLDLGAAHITICLDADNQSAEHALEAHPQVTVIRTTRDYWIDLCGYVPKKHQVRQALNATRAYKAATQLDWLTHIDVDEFLCPQRPIDLILADVPADYDALRLVPCESLCLEDQRGLDRDYIYCKARPSLVQNGKQIEAALHPNFGGFFKDGFVSHTAGKLFLRSQRPVENFGIHRALGSQKQEMSEIRSSDIELAHLHVKSWQDWCQIMEFRLSAGSYREELGQNIPLESGRMSRFNLFQALRENGGEDLRAFFEEVCLATPELCQKLTQYGLLRRYKLDLSLKVQKHFPDFMV